VATQKSQLGSRLSLAERLRTRFRRSLNFLLPQRTNTADGKSESFAKLCMNMLAIQAGVLPNRQPPLQPRDDMQGTVVCVAFPQRVT